jgi:hypothetical protein
MHAAFFSAAGPLERHPNGRRARRHGLTQHSPTAAVAKTREVYEGAIGMSGKTR